jgi:hypothetical protein
MAAGICSSVVVFVAVFFLCVHAKAKGYAIDKWMIAVGYDALYLPRSLYRSLAKRLHAPRPRTDPQAATKLRSRLAEQRLDQQRNDVNAALNLQSLRFENVLSNFGQTESTVQFSRRSQRDQPRGFTPVKTIFTKEPTPPAASSSVKQLFADECGIVEFLRTQHLKVHEEAQAPAAAQKFIMAGQNKHTEANVDPVNLDSLVAPYLSTQSRSYEDVPEAGRLPWASQKQVEAQTYFPHKYALASAAHVTSPMPPFLSHESGVATASGVVHGGAEGRYASLVAGPSTVRTRRSASPVAGESQNSPSSSSSSSSAKCTCARLQPFVVLAVLDASVERKSRTYSLI